MRKHPLLLLMALMFSGCSWINENFSDRLLFVEESHIGLKAKVGIDHTPGDVDFGYRRSVVTLIPKANATAEDKSDANKPKEAISQPAKQATASSEMTDKDCPSDPADAKEPLSVISSFNADVRWFEATRVRTYFATGKAAAQTACDVEAIKALVAKPSE